MDIARKRVGRVVEEFERPDRVAEPELAAEIDVGGGQTPSSTRRIDSSTKACSSRLIAKPATSLTRIGVLPIPRRVSATASA